MAKRTLTIALAPRKRGVSGHPLQCLVTGFGEQLGVGGQLSSRDRFEVRTDVLHDVLRTHRRAGDDTKGLGDRMAGDGLGVDHEQNRGGRHHPDISARDISFLTRSFLVMEPRSGDGILIRVRAHPNEHEHADGREAAHQDAEDGTPDCEPLE